MFASTVDKDTRFCHTESSYSNSFVARCLIIPQVFYCCNMLWHWTVTEGWKTQVAARIAAESLGIAYEGASYTTVVDQVRYVVQWNCVVILGLLFV